MDDYIHACIKLTQNLAHQILVGLRDNRNLLLSQLHVSPGLVQLILEALSDCNQGLIPYLEFITLQL